MIPISFADLAARIPLYDNVCNLGDPINVLLICLSLLILGEVQGFVPKLSLFGVALEKRGDGTLRDDHDGVLKELHLTALGVQTVNLRLGL